MKANLIAIAQQAAKAIADGRAFENIQLAAVGAGILKEVIGMVRDLGHSHPVTVEDIKGAAAAYLTEADVAKHFDAWDESLDLLESKAQASLARRNG